MNGNRAWESLACFDSPCTSDTKAEQDANEKDDRYDTNDTPESIEKSFAFVKQSLAGLGLSDQLDIQSKDTQDVGRVCRCLLELVRQRQADARQKDDLRVEVDRQRTRGDGAVREVARLERALDAKHREVGDLAIQLRSLGDAHKAERTTLQREHTQLTRSLAQQAALIKASEQQMRRKEAECERLVDKLRGMTGGGRSASSETARTPSGAASGTEMVAGVRRARLNGRAPGDFEAQQHLVDTLRLRAEALARDNEMLRAQLVDLQAQQCQLLGCGDLPAAGKEGGSTAVTDDAAAAAPRSRNAARADSTGRQQYHRSLSVEVAAPAVPAGHVAQVERLQASVAKLQAELAAARKTAAAHQQASKAAALDRDRSSVSEHRALDTARRAVLKLQAVQRAAQQQQEEEELAERRRTAAAAHDAATAAATAAVGPRAGNPGDEEGQRRRDNAGGTTGGSSNGDTSSVSQPRFNAVLGQREALRSELREREVELLDLRKQLVVADAQLSAANTKAALMNKVVSMTFRGEGPQRDLAERVAALVEAGVAPVHEALQEARCNWLDQHQRAHDLEVELNRLRHTAGPVVPASLLSTVPPPAAAAAAARTAAAASIPPSSTSIPPSSTPVPPGDSPVSHVLAPDAISDPSSPSTSLRSANSNSSSNPSDNGRHFVEDAAAVPQSPPPPGGAGGTHVRQRWDLSDLARQGMVSPRQLLQQADDVEPSAGRPGSADSANSSFASRASELSLADHHHHSSAAFAFLAPPPLPPQHHHQQKPQQKSAAERASRREAGGGGSRRDAATGGGESQHQGCDVSKGGRSRSALYYHSDGGALGVGGDAGGTLGDRFPLRAGGGSSGGPVLRSRSASCSEAGDAPQTLRCEGRGVLQLQKGALQLQYRRTTTSVSGDLAGEAVYGSCGTSAGQGGRSAAAWRDAGGAVNPLFVFEEVLAMAALQQEPDGGDVTA